MRSRRLAQKLPLAIPVVLVVLLAMLATLQYHWSGKVSALEQQRMKASLLRDGAHFSEDFDREVTRAFLYFHPSPAVPAGQRIERVSQQYDHWMSDAPYPHLIREVYLIRPAQGGARLEVLRPEEHRFVPTSWTPELAEARRHVEAILAHPEARGFGLGMTLGGEVPGLLIPLSFQAPAGTRADDPLAGTHVLVRFDPQTIDQEILPALTQRYFKNQRGNEYVVAVREAQEPQRLLFVSDPKFPLSSLKDGDLQVGMFGLRPFDELRSLSSEHGMVMHTRHPERHPDSPWPRMGVPAFEGHHRGYGAWRLVLKHRDGTLEEAVTAIRRRNLAISLGILGLLGITSGLMFVTAQRAQRLARQQIEFVAGVTHELHTPLTAIRSAGQNLADGVVADPSQVKRYGTLIESEGRRLSDMVGQALEFAGIQSGRRVYHPRPAGVEEIVGGALQDCRWLLQEKRIQVEREIEPGLPLVMVDAAALRRAVANLIENAVKYGGRGAWIGVRVRRDPAGPVEITVSDRGPGIRKEDVPHLFKPFFRGRDGATAGVPGSGLGLSLVRHIAEAHGGRITVATGPEGTSFTLRLPELDADETVAAVEAPA
ncbi:MAG TPA: HAMP domain-containing sensor histidine kinase [Thermoanaerobaculia bacterium]|nr:HAMP domain-containing sensor histidine kinase [Thermoanaerobaculia bacterium]